MNNIFEKFAPRWRRVVSNYARRIWTGRADMESEWDYDRQSDLFSREYRHALEKYYAKRKMRVYRGTLEGWVIEWQRKQDALKETLKIITEDKQNKLVADEIEKLKDSPDAQAMIDKLYEAKENETVYKVFSFRNHLEDKAQQIGDETAYELGTGINERIIKNFSDRYFWMTQKDRRVRNTHIQLNGKCFQFGDPPTTVDKYGRRFSGNPGTDYGCRCWSEIAPEKEKTLAHYVVYEK